MSHVDWQGEYECLMALVLDAMVLPADEEALIRLFEAAEDYTLRRLHWQVAWSDADEDQWAGAAAEAQRDYPA